MTFDEAIYAAKKGHKVSPVNRAFFVFHHPENGYMRVTVGLNYDVKEYFPTPYEMMMTWAIYEKSPMRKVKDFFNRAFGSFGRLSSNPS